MFTIKYSFNRKYWSTPSTANGKSTISETYIIGLPINVCPSSLIPAKDKINISFNMEI